MAEQWWVSRNGHTIGPLNREGAQKALASAGTDAFVSNDGKSWMAAKDSALSAPCQGGSIFNRKFSTWWLVVPFVPIFAWLGIAWAWSALTYDGTTAVPEVPASQPKPAPNPKRKPKEPDLGDKLLATTDPAKAAGLVREALGDSHNDYPAGVPLLALWAGFQLDWSELQKVPKTSVVLVAKDSESEVGKRICVRGRILEIAAERLDGTKVFVGGLSMPGFDILRFIAVRSSGKLVKRSPARFCGIVTGRYSYSNVSGGMTKSLMAVGLFDLPENREPLKPLKKAK